jgi:hypothetical protein
MITVALEERERQTASKRFSFAIVTKRRTSETHAMEAPKRRLAMRTMAASFIRIVLSVSTFCHFNVMAVERKA